MEICPLCGSDAVEYIGVQDGLGAYGGTVADVYRCVDCDTCFESGEYWEMTDGPDNDENDNSDHEGGYNA